MPRPRAGQRRRRSPEAPESAVPELPETRFSKRIDAALSAAGRAASWLWLVLLGVIVVNVTLRYAFGEGRIELEELQWHLNAAAFLAAITYGYRVDAHIRIDLVSSRLPPRRRAWMELLGTVLLLLPFLALVLWFGVPFFWHSWAVSEVSASPGGLPWRWLLKALLPLTALFLIAAAAARLSRVWRYLATGDMATGDGR